MNSKKPKKVIVHNFLFVGTRIHYSKLFFKKCFDGL